MSRLIDADALMEILSKAIRNMKCVANFIGEEDDPEIEMGIKAYTDILNGAKHLPTIEPEQKKGKWVDYIGRDLGIEGQWLRDDGKTVFMQCDQCDSLFVRNLMIHANFCPNCGADMRGEQDE